jgi:hypothetical protein
MILYSTSVSPGAVMKNGRCAVAIGFGEAVKETLLSSSGGWLHPFAINAKDASNLALLVD